MPIVPELGFRNTWYMRGGHMETVVPSLYRKVPVPFERERIDTPDGDFLDLDWLRKSSDTLVVIAHGLEGSSTRHYVTGTAKLMHAAGWDVLAWNCRSCSGEMNKAYRFYHHGETEDLHTIFKHVYAQRAYKHIGLVGYSMGGSISLRYLADYANEMPATIRTAIGVSVPISLQNSAEELHKRGNAFYRNRFLKKLKAKFVIKAQQYPDKIDLDRLEKVNTFAEFDTHFTAPMFGFKDAADFYQQASVGPHLKSIPRPIYLINALNDPMLGAACYPEELARQHEHIHLEMPKFGGHVGFWRPASPYTYAELRALEWMRAHLGTQQ